MLKVLTLLVGMVGGAGGASAFLLSWPKPSETPPSEGVGSERLDTLKARVALAREEGRRAGQMKQMELKHRWEAQRGGKRA